MDYDRLVKTLLLKEKTIIIILLYFLLIAFMNFTMYVITGIRVRKQAMIQYLQDRNYDFSVIEEIRVPFGLIPGYPTFGSIFVTFTDIDETCSFYYNDNNGHIRKTHCWYSHKKE